VTVEQAARIAGVDADELVERLNAGGSADAHSPAARGRGAARDPDGGPRVDGGLRGRGDSTTAASDLPPSLAAIPHADVIELDVREDLRNGQEPFSRIMAARREVPSGGALGVRAIFEPVPLYAVMEKQGLTHHTERLGPEDWRVWFYAEAGAASAGTPARGGPPPRAHADDPSDGPEEREPPVDVRPLAHISARASAVASDDVVVLDVRGLEPPEPMVRTLAALEELPPGGTLVQVNVRVPRFLLPRLEERGFTYEVREQAPDLVRVFIRRAAPDAGER